ncbi:uncharacterized protein SRS1_16515 [Sporisorium reilianum f. sp. reilianum]|uniref:Uncharacterized protein n=1 Tax=Sporisorium reilianum f. sp. reilianum TaxID=72559 RepID=A0A2N8UM78_9BASI|nr:uncharacterized protein SRS1_16515 [Sporisorium reilianum f. sp. reilianum]
MSGTSPESGVPTDGDARPPDTTMAPEGEQGTTVVPAWLTLPTEIWERIASFLLPAIQPERHVYPSSDFRPIEHKIKGSETSCKDLVVLALSCKQLNSIALKALYRAPFLYTMERLNSFVETICQNDRGVLVPESCRSAGWIRALHVTATMMDVFDDLPPKRFCACDVHILLSFADQVRYLSLTCDDGRQGDYWEDELEDHLLAHVLSSSTKCRPLGLRYNTMICARELSLAKVTSYAPLSQLTHLELVGNAPPPELLAFLVAAPHLAPSDPKVEEAVSAGLSPHSKLQCLRLCDEQQQMLQHFGDFIAYRARRAGLFDHDEPDQSQHALYDLAINSSNLPNLRLLVIEAGAPYMSLPEDLLKKFVDKEVLKDVSKELPSTVDAKQEFATNSLSPLFSKYVVKAAMHPYPGADSLDSSLNEADPAWQSHFRKADEYWQQVQQGKQDLLKLWNRSRTKNGLRPTEIRVVASRGFESTTEAQYDFYCQAQNFDVARTEVTEGSSRDGDPIKTSAFDRGVWADPDVFSLVEFQPWLGYRQLPEYGCCCWSGKLPRDSNPNAIPSGAGGETKRIVLPPIIELALEELGEEKLESYRRSKRLARQDKDTKKAKSKRQRTDLNVTQELGPATT